MLDDIAVYISLKMRSLMVIPTFLLLVISEIRCLLPASPNNTNIVPTTPPDGCFTPEGQKIRRNEMVPAIIGECYGIRCNFNLELEEEECEPAIVGKGCHGRSYDFSFLYPDCCPAAVC